MPAAFVWPHVNYNFDQIGYFKVNNAYLTVQMLPVGVCSCTCYIHSNSKWKTFLGSEEILSGPHNLKVCF